MKKHNINPTPFDLTDGKSAAEIFALADPRYIRKLPTANDNLIQVTTADKSALILQTTDDDPTKNLFELKNASGG